MSKILDRARAHIRGLQAYPPGKPIAELERELGISGAIKLGSNESPLGPSPRALEAVVDGLRELNRYPDGSCYYIREALAKRLGVSGEHLLFGAGSDELLEMFVKVFVDPGDEVVFFWPSFAMYPIVTQGMGGVARSVELSAPFELDVARLLEAVNQRTKLVFIANPNNPTGTSIGDLELETLLSGMPAEAIVVLDEAYVEYVRRPDRARTLERLRDRHNLVSLRTFSKIYGLAGLRIGYAVGSPELIEVMERARHPFNVSSVAQAAALAALEDEGHVNAVRELTHDGLEQLESGLQALGLECIPSDANFVLVNVGQDGVELDRRLQRRGVIARSLRPFGLTHYLRVTAGLPDENARFLETLREELEAS